jgi:hypothetical protein
MATNTNNRSSGSKNHLSSSSSLLDGSPSPSPQTYYNAQGWDQRDDNDGNRVPLPVLFAVFLGVILLLRFFCTRGGRTDTVEHEAGGGDDDGRGWVGRSPSSTVAGAAMEMAPPLVCAYRKPDGLGEDSCGVCLAEMADGEPVRVLPACLHYFHAACVNEWLRGHEPARSAALRSSLPAAPSSSFHG